MLDIDFYNDKYSSKFIYPREYAIIDAVYDYGVCDDDICYLKKDDEPIMYVFSDDKVVKFTVDNNKSWFTYLLEGNADVKVISRKLGELRNKQYITKRKRYVVSFEFDGDTVVLDPINDSLPCAEELYINEIDNIIDILGI